MRCELGASPDCKVHRWQLELNLLRLLINQCGLTEECKWGSPCYTYNGKNVLMLSALKHYCCVSFFKGSLLQDQKKLLEKPGPNSQAARLFKFIDVTQIEEIATDIKSYIFEAIEVEKAGLTVEFKKEPLEIPVELQNKFEEDPAFENAFYSLTPGRQRGYLIHFNQAKQSKTRINRIEKHHENIMQGIGLNDKYSSKKQ